MRSSSFLRSFRGMAASAFIHGPHFTVSKYLFESFWKISKETGAEPHTHTERWKWREEKRRQRERETTHDDGGGGGEMTSLGQKERAQNRKTNVLHFGWEENLSQIRSHVAKSNAILAENTHFPRRKLRRRERRETLFGKEKEREREREKREGTLCSPQTVIHIRNFGATTESERAEEIISHNRERDATTFGDARRSSARGVWRRRRRGRLLFMSTHERALTRWRDVYLLLPKCINSRP